MAEVSLSTAADGDLADILEYSIQVFGAAVARKYVKSFEEAFDLLRRHPNAGAMRAEFEPPMRCLPHRSHRIFYDIEGDIVLIVRVLHHSVDAQRWLTE